VVRWGDASDVVEHFLCIPPPRGTLPWPVRSSFLLVFAVLLGDACAHLPACPAKGGPRWTEWSSPRFRLLTDIEDDADAEVLAARGRAGTWRARTSEDETESWKPPPWPSPNSRVFGVPACGPCLAQRGANGRGW